MRVAFILDTIRFSIPLGIAYIAGSLNKGGHLADVFLAQDLEGTIQELKNFKPDVLAFSVISGEHTHYLKIAAGLKKALNVPTLWGGPHPTFFPEMIEDPSVDFVCIGEGEEAVLSFANFFDENDLNFPTETHNFWIKKGNEIFKNKIIARNKDLDSVPWPDREIFFKKFSILKNHGVKHFLAHRGCPYKCTYCFNEGYNTLYKKETGDGKIFVARDPNSIVDEILAVHKVTPIKMVHFVDDVFTLHRKWTLKFCDVYQKRCEIPFSLNTRFDLVDEELLKIMKGAGLNLVYAGVESGNHFIRNKVMKRNMTVESMLNTGKLFKKFKIKLLTENILGAPGETFKSALETLKVNMKLKPDIGNASIFAPYPKLEMTNYAIEKGYFDGDFNKLSNSYYHGSLLKFDTPSDKGKVLNIRCFFSLLSRYPFLYPIIKPLLHLPNNLFFRWIGDLLDGYFLLGGLSYKMGVWDFLKSVAQYFGGYRKTLEIVKPNSVAEVKNRLANSA